MVICEMVEFSIRIPENILALHKSSMQMRSEIFGNAAIEKDGSWKRFVALIDSTNPWITRLFSTGPLQRF